MKKTTKAFLMIVTGLFMLTVAMVSCKKDKNSDPIVDPVVPTITSIAPATDTVGQVITITGTNLAGATVKVGGITATTSAVSATSVTTTVPAGVALGTVAVVVTVTGGGSVSSNITIVEPIVLPASSNDVAAAKLAAYWPFRADSKETKSGSSAEKNVGVTFGGTGGPFGAYGNFSTGYLLYPPIDVLNQRNSLDQFTISMWVKIKNNNKDLYPATGGRYTSLFSLNSTQIGGVYGPYSFTLHTNQDRPVDEFAFGAVVRNIDNHQFAYGESADENYDHIDDSVYAVKTIAGAGDGSKWIHVVQTFFGYSANPRPLVTYINGEKVDEHPYYRLIWDGENLNPKPGPDSDNPLSKITFGTFAFAEDFAVGPWGAKPPSTEAVYWAHGITAGMSDVRFFKEPLEDADVSALYQLGLLGK